MYLYSIYSIDLFYHIPGDASLFCLMILIEKTSKTIKNAIEKE